MTDETTGRDVELPWWPARRPSTGRTPLDRDRIVAAALRRIDEGGLDALSMRKLGDDLGVGATTIYWHVGSKDELLDLVLDQVMAEILADMHWGGGWRTQLAEAGQAIRRVLLRHRHVGSMIGARLALGPHTLSAFDQLLGILVDAGFPDHTADLAGNAVINHAIGWAVLESRNPQDPVAEGRSQKELDQVVLGMFRSLPAGQFPNIRRITVDAEALTGADEQFDYAQRCLIEGIAGDLARPGAQS